MNYGLYYLFKMGKIVRMGSLTPEEKQKKVKFIKECLSEKGRYKGCSLKTRIEVLKIRIIWFFLRYLI